MWSAVCHERPAEAIIIQHNGRQSPPNNDWVLTRRRGSRSECNNQSLEQEISSTGPCHHIAEEGTWRAAADGPTWTYPEAGAHVREHLSVRAHLPGALHAGVPSIRHCSVGTVAIDVTSSLRDVC
jgi:hypothetical protein